MVSERRRFRHELMKRKRMLYVPKISRLQCTIFVRTTYSTSSKTAGIVFVVRHVLVLRRHLVARRENHHQAEALYRQTRRHGGTF